MERAAQLERGNQNGAGGAVPPHSPTDQLPKFAVRHYRVAEIAATDTLRAVAAPRRRGPSLARRTYQAGSVFQKGRNKTQEWLPDAAAYGRFWKDVPGKQPQRIVVSLGMCRTRTLAERKCWEHIEKLGVNSTQHFVESTSNVTFKQQGEFWLRSLANRKRNPIEQTTIDTRRCALDNWIYPFLGDTYLADINNRMVKELVEHMATAEPKPLAPGTIREYLQFLKAVVASAIDENGEEKFPRKWNHEYIDAPAVRKQRQPTTDCAGISDIILFATGQYRMLYALLAGCGPLRVGEAFGLEIDKHISSDFRTLTIVQKVKCRRIQDHLKTAAGEREVDLCSSLSAMLRDFVGPRTSGLLFRNRKGTPLDQARTLADYLHPILDYLGHQRGGFNIFRRFRRTHIDTFECPDALKHFWSGHAPTHVSERYIKLTQNRDFRLMWAEKIGLGFDLPGERNGQRGLLLQFPKAV